MKVCKKAPVVSHIFFANDSYIYCKAETEEARNVMELLEIYEKASGQKINSNKSTMFFSDNITEYNKEQVCQVFCIREADDSSKYLGLPNNLGRNKSTVFGYLKDKVMSIIQNWNGKKVSKPAKEILIKMVARFFRPML